MRTTLGAVAFALLAFAGCRPSLPDPTLKGPVRPLTVRLVDADTEAPLAGLRVLRIVEIERYASWIALEPDWPEYRETWATTDADGTVRFPLERLDLPSRHYLHDEHLFVNLDVDPEAMRRPWYAGEPIARVRESCFHEDWGDHDPLCLAPLEPRWRGWVVFNTSFPFDLAQQGSPTRERFDILWNGESLRKPEERLVLRLARARAR